jgi:SAM-dependent MidA family methyltransferase
MSQLLEIIKAEIALQGAIPFARFMELALYCPDYGFYERESDTVGRGGDFYTSVSVGSLFGELLAFRFAGWLEEISTGKLQIVEAGAHDGKLALDIMRWLARRRPQLFERIEYVISEPSARRQQWQRRRLAEFGEQVRWLKKPLDAQAIPITGVIFSNELLDAMPVHRLGWNAKKQVWYEWSVAWEAGAFVWKSSALTLALEHFEWLPQELLAVLPDGFTTEICPGAENWWARAAKSLQAGRLMTLDYGLKAEEFFAAHRAEGTLRAYRRHRNSVDLLADAGEQDLTAHVNFTQIQSSGMKAGLRTELYASQADFIAGIVKEFWAEAERQGDWSPQRNRELQTLMHPEHLGRAFRVLVQSR